MSQTERKHIPWPGIRFPEEIRSDMPKEGNSAFEEKEFASRLKAVEDLLDNPGADIKRKKQKNYVKERVRAFVNHPHELSLPIYTEEISHLAEVSPQLFEEVAGQFLKDLPDQLEKAALEEQKVKLRRIFSKDQIDTVSLKSYVGDLNKLRENAEKHYESVDKVIDNLYPSLEKAACGYEETPSDEQLHPVLKMYKEKGEYHKEAEAILSGWVKSTKDEEEITRLLSNILLDAYKHPDDEELNLTVARITSFVTPIFPKGSVQFQKYLAAFYLTDPEREEVLARALDIDHASKLLRDITNDNMSQKSYSAAFAKARAFVEASPEEKAIMSEEEDEYPYVTQTMVEGFKKNPKRLRQLMDMYDSEEQRIRKSGGGPMDVSTLILASELPFPLRLLNLPRELRLLYQERYVDYLGAINKLPHPETFNLWMPDGSFKTVGFIDRNKESQDVLRVSLELGDGGMVEREESVRDMLEYLRPELSDVQAANLDGFNESLSDELFYEQGYTLSPRGELVVQPDHVLQKYGLDRILYEMDTKTNDIIVTVGFGEEGKFSVQLRLDEYFRLREPNRDPNSTLSAYSKTWWRTVLLTHLRPMLIREQGVLEDINLEGWRLLENESEMSVEKYYSRKGYFRRLPEGQYFTPRHYLTMLNERASRDLLEYNMMHGITETDYKIIKKRLEDAGVEIDESDYEKFESSLVKRNGYRVRTWVRPVTVENAKKGLPIKHIMPNVMDEASFSMYAGSTKDDA
jgi:hypothetical protein